VDDLEAAATSSDGKIYLITSHSDTRRGAVPARQRLLEVSITAGQEGELKGKITRSTNSSNALRKIILEKIANNGLPDPYRERKEIKEGKEVQVNEVIAQIEGLAIDEQGYAYLGFSAPLTKEGYALVLQAKLSDLFSDNIQFKAFQLNVWHNNKNHGISSLDYDIKTKRMIIIGNAPGSSNFLDHILCQWDFAGDYKEESIQITTCFPIPHSKVSASTPSTSKIELLLIPPASVSNKVFMFLDTDGKGDGGQISFPRTKFGLK
jgi:hypothetical protein